MIHHFFKWSAIAVWCASAFLVSRYPAGLWWWIAAGALIDGALIVLNTQHAHPSRVHMYLPWLMGAYAALFLFMFIDRPLFRNIWLASVALMSILYWYKAEAWARASAEHEARMSRLGALWLALAVISGGIALYAWQVFADQNAWSVVFWLAVISAGTTVGLWKLMSKTLSPEAFLYIIVILLISFELFWVVGFTTFGFATKGFFWASGVWYSWRIAGLIQSKKIKFAVILKSTALLFASWISIFLFTRWF